MRTRLHLTILVVAAIAVAAPACLDVGDPLFPASGGLSSVPEGPLAFDEHVMPILERYGCTGCHGVGGGSARLDVTSAEGLAVGGRSGPATVPCDAEASLVYQRVADCSMPPTGDRCLSAVEVAVVARWIDQGAAQTFDPQICPDPPLR